MLFLKSQEFFSFSLTIHRLAAKSFLQTKDMGFRETPAKDKKDVLKVSIDCGVISSHTAFIAVNKDLNEPVQGPLVRRDVPRPILLSATAVMSRYRGSGKFYLIRIHKIGSPGCLNTSCNGNVYESSFSPLFLHI